MMVALIVGISRYNVACKEKNPCTFKQYKEDKLVNEVSKNDTHECKFYELMDL